MTKDEFITEVTPQFNEDGDKILMVNGKIQFIKEDIVISELTPKGEYREYYTPTKNKRRKRNG